MPFSATAKHLLRPDTRAGRRLVAHVEPAVLQTLCTCVAILLVTMLVTAMFWEWVGPRSRVDVGGDYGAFYEPVGRRLLEDGRPIFTDGSPATRYPPGYPMLLAALFGFARVTGLAEASVLWGFALLATALCGVLLFLMARTVWPARFALAAPIAWGSCPFVLWLAGIEGSELSFCLVFYASCYAFWTALRRPRVQPGLYLLAGVLIGVAMLIRPIAIAGGAVMVGVVWLGAPAWLSQRARLAAGALLLIGNVIAVAPWEAWVYASTGRVIMLSDGGVASIRDGLTFATTRKSFRSGVAVPADVEAVIHNLESRYEELRSLGDIGAALTREAATRPLGVAKLLGLKVLRTWYGTDSHRNEAQIAGLQALYFLPVALGALIAWRRGSAPRLLVVLVVAFTLYFWAMTVLVLSIVRYMVPVLGLLFLFVPGALAEAHRLYTTARRPVLQ